MKKSSDGLVGLKPFHRAKYIVLHHGQREAGFHKVCTSKPAVNQQIVEAYSALGGILHHLDGLVNTLINLKSWHKSTKNFPNIR